MSDEPKKGFESKSRTHERIDKLESEVRRIKEPVDEKNADLNLLTFRYDITMLKGDVKKLRKESLETNKLIKGINKLINLWDRRIKFYKNLVEHRKSEGLRLTEEESHIDFCVNILGMSYRIVGNLLGCCKATIHSRIQSIEEKRKKKEERKCEKKLRKNEKIFETVRPKRYKSYRDRRFGKHKKRKKSDDLMY